RSYGDWSSDVCSSDLVLRPALQAAQKAGVKPILGCELYVAPGSRKERGSQDGGYEGANHLTVLARNRAGYRNLIKLVSKAYLEEIGRASCRERGWSGA